MAHILDESKLSYNKQDNVVMLSLSREPGARTHKQGYVEIVEDEDGKPVRILIHRADELFADLDGLFTEVEEPEYITVQELSLMKGVAQQTIRNHIALGKLPAKKIGEGKRAIVLIKRSDAENFSLGQPGRPRATP